MVKFTKTKCPNLKTSHDDQNHIRLQEQKNIPTLKTSQLAKFEILNFFSLSVRPCLE